MASTSSVVLLDPDCSLGSDAKHTLKYRRFSWCARALVTTMNATRLIVTWNDIVELLEPVGKGFRSWMGLMGVAVPIVVGIAWDRVDDVSGPTAWS